jgi:ABC-type polysaccharide/polyol phosphate transport system ATPase subunit
MNVIEFTNVWKKFKRGEKLNSLRDALPYYFSQSLPWNRDRKRPDRNQVLEQSEFWSLEDVSFDVPKGDILGIIGPNGAGKSTILKLLSKIMIPNRGTMTINGRLSALIEVTAGFHPDLTGRENVFLNGTILGMSRKEIDTKFDDIVEFSGLKEFIDTPVKRYSSGMYSRLGFSVAAHMDPDILLVDEVLSVGDIAFQSKSTRKMKELIGSGATIVLVSHDLALIQNLCRRVILLDAGKILKEGPSEEIIPYYQDLIYRKSEEDLKREIASSSYKVRLNDEAKIGIQRVVFKGEQGAGDRFRVGEPVTVRIEYESKETITDPVFSLEIIRSDSVLCCASNSRDDGFSLPRTQGQGAVEIALKNLRLSPGIYILKISIWDAEMLHPFVVRKQDILRFESSEVSDNIQRGVFIHRFHWGARNVPEPAVSVNGQQGL